MKKNSKRKDDIKLVEQLLLLFGNRKLSKNSNLYRKLNGDGPKEKTEAVTTKEQLTVRLKFGLVGRVVALCLPMLTLSYRFQYTQSRRNARKMLYKQIYNGLVMGKYPDLTIDYRKICLSPGGRAPLWRLIYAASGSGIMDLSWLAYELKTNYRHESAAVYIFVLNETKGKSELFGPLAYSTTCQLKVQLSGYLEGDQLHCWVLLRWEDERQVSFAEYAEHQDSITHLAE